MNTVYLLYHLARADFLERVRRYSFLVTLVLAMYLGYIYLPDDSAGYVTVAMDHARGIYNSAWVGAVFALMTSTFVTLIGFYLVKNSVTRDQDTRVGQILASTQLSKFNYLLGKTLSNFCVLASIAGVLSISAVVMQLVRGEDMQIHIWQLVSPMLLMSLPFLAVIAATAVLFEVTPGLRGAFGNVAYFFLWNFVFIMSLSPMERGQSAVRHGYNDLPGVSWIMENMTSLASEVVPNFKGNVSLGIQILTNEADKMKFVWPGMNWTLDIVVQRLFWVGVALGIVLVATLIFRRFEVASPVRLAKKSGKPAKLEQQATPLPIPANLHLAPLTQALNFSFVRLFLAELRLSFKSVSKWWYLVAGGLVIASLFTPIAVARQFIYPAAWIWPVALWSAMGTREKKHGTEQVIFASPHLLSRQLPALWLVGVTLAVATSIGIGLRLTLLGDTSGLLAWGVGALFVPTFALAAGVWAGRPILFEALYVALWYIGPMNRVPFLDYMGASGMVSAGTISTVAIVTAGLALAAIIGRKRQLAI